MLWEPVHPGGHASRQIWADQTQRFPGVRVKEWWTRQGMHGGHACALCSSAGSSVAVSAPHAAAAAASRPVNNTDKTIQSSSRRIDVHHPSMENWRWSSSFQIQVVLRSVVRRRGLELWFVVCGPKVKSEIAGASVFHGRCPMFFFTLASRRVQWRETCIQLISGIFPLIW